jgi:DNA-binding CsgD family transcriptional regulator
MKKRGRPRHPEILTPREQEVLSLLSDGLSTEQIAEQLGISVPGMKFHVSEILGRLNLESRAEAIEWQRASKEGAFFGAFQLVLRPKMFAAAVGFAAVVGTGIFVGILFWGVSRTVRHGSKTVPLAERSHCHSDSAYLATGFEALEDIPAGRKIDASMVCATGTSMTVTDRNVYEVVGLVARRALSVGEPIRADDVRRPTGAASGAGCGDIGLPQGSRVITVFAKGQVYTGRSTLSLGTGPWLENVPVLVSYIDPPSRPGYSLITVALPPEEVRPVATAEERGVTIEAVGNRSSRPPLNLCSLQPTSGIP